MCAENVLHSFSLLPLVLIAKRPISALFVDIFHLLPKLLREALAKHRLLEEEGIVHIASRVALWLEEGVEVPERTFNVFTCRHLIETHLEKDLSEEGAYLQQGVEVATFRHLSLRVEVVVLEL